VGGLLLLFGGTATVAWVALAGLRHGQHERRQTTSILLAVTVTWSLSWIGILASVSGPFGHELGYWSMLVSVGVVIVGTIFVWVSARHATQEADSAAGPEPPTEVPVG
jgi:Na+/proline symporter